MQILLVILHVNHNVIKALLPMGITINTNACHVMKVVPLVSIMERKGIKRNVKHAPRNILSYIHLKNNVYPVVIVDFIKLILPIVINVMSRAKGVQEINITAHHAIIKRIKKYYK